MTNSPEELKGFFGLPILEQVERFQVPSIDTVSRCPVHVHGCMQTVFHACLDCMIQPGEGLFIDAPDMVRIHLSRFRPQDIFAYLFPNSTMQVTDARATIAIGF